MNNTQKNELFGDWTPESGISKTDAFFNKLFQDIEEGTFPTVHREQSESEKKDRREYRTATIEVVVNHYTKKA